MYCFGFTFDLFFLCCCCQSLLCFFFFFFVIFISICLFFFFFSSRRRHTRSLCDWSSDVCSSDLGEEDEPDPEGVLLVLGEPRDVVVLDVHVERRRSPGHLLADVAEADDAERQDRKSVV